MERDGGGGGCERQGERESESRVSRLLRRDVFCRRTVNLRRPEKKDLRYLQDLTMHDVHPLDDE